MANIDDIDDTAILKNPLSYAARAAQTVANIHSVGIPPTSEDDDQSVITANLLQHRLQQTGISFTHEENTPNRP